MKRNYIQLIKDVKEDGTPELETFFTPNFIPFRKVYEAVELLDSDSNSDKQNMLESFNFIAELYNNEFTTDDLLDRLHAPDALNEIRSQIEFVSQGFMDDERKKKLKQMLS